MSPDDFPVLPAPHRSEWPWLALTIAAILPLLIACACERHLAMDGVNAFINVLDRRECYIPTPARLVSDTLIQYPLLAAVLAGVTSLPVLVAIYGFGVMLPFWFGAIAAWYALPVGRKHFMALPIWSLLVLTFPVDGHLTHQSHVMTPLLWPALFLIARTEAWRPLEATLLFVCLGALALSYETVCFPAILLAGLAVRRWRGAANRTQRGLALAAAVGALMIVAVGVTTILVPADAGNKANFAASLLEPWVFGQVPVGTVAVTLFLAGWVAGRGRLLRLLGMLLVGAAVWWCVRRELPIRGGAYQARTLALTLMPLIYAAGAALFVARRPMPAQGLAVCALAVAVLSAPFFGHLARWLNYREEVTRLTRAGRGFIDVKGTKLEWDWERNSWNLPELSLVWGGNPAQAVIVNPPGWPWEPFDPRKELPLSRYVEIDRAALPVQRTPARAP